MLVVAGCGKKTVEVKGTVVFPASLKLIDSDSAKILFVPETEGVPGASGAISNSDSSFTVNGPKGKGIALGKYKIAVRLRPYPGDPASEQRAQLFARIHDRYDELASKLIYEVSGNSSITVDLVKGTVTKN
ncbi:MAG TPA: hypothetical protein VMG10_04400 [Gemmataceae bacterium]|nr:hypothetical protein [Gemmataceae bacterium]